MKKILLLSVLALFFLAFNSCEKDEVTPVVNSIATPDVNASGAIVTRANATVPFIGHYTTYPEVTEPVNGVFEDIPIPSVGKATHLGKSTWYSESDVNFNIPNTGPQVCGAGEVYQDGSSIFTAADGSQLIGEFLGWSYYVDPTHPFAGCGDYWINEGTGRFVGATGSGTYSYIVTIIDGVLVGELDFIGTLTNP